MKKIRNGTAVALVLLALSSLGTSSLPGIRNIVPSTSGGIQVSIPLDGVRASDEVGEKANVTLWVRDSQNKTSLGDLNLTIFDLEEGISSTYTVNQTGHISLFQLETGSYVVSAQENSRTVGFQKIDVSENGTYVVRTWSYDLNMTLVNKEGEPLANHTVTLYDQMIFQAPNYTVTASTVRRGENYTVITDEVGRPVRRAETDENGTVHFGSVWNGTYRIGILGKDVWIEEYVLGELVRTLQKASAGQYVADLQEPVNATVECFRADLRLNFTSKADAPVKNTTVQIRNMLGHLLFEGLTNNTGFFEKRNVYVIDDAYEASAGYGDRIIGRAVIDAREDEIFIVRCWAYDIAVRCVDLDGRPLSDHTVFLYDQLVFYSPTNVTVVTNQTGVLVNWTRTDEDGMSHFYDVWEGTYWVRVVGGETVGEKIVELKEAESISIVGNKTYMSLKFVTSSGAALSGATVIVSSQDGDLIFRSRTDKNGYVRREGLYIGDYTVHVEWMRTQAWSGSVDIWEDRDETISCMVYRLTVDLVDTFGNKLPKADVKLERRITGLNNEVISTLETDEVGRISLLLPYGSYEVSCSYGIYAGLLVVNLNRDYSATVTCSVSNLLWVSMLSVSVPLVAFTLFLERRRLRTPLEVNKYQNMLSRLESMYGNGLVEYKIYRKLREEYEAKIMELGGRGMR